MADYNDYFCDNKWMPAHGDSVHALISPVTEQHIGSLQLCSQGDLEDVIYSARRGFDAWRFSSVAERREALGRLGKAVEARTAQLAHLLALEIGCPLGLSEGLHIPMGLSDIKHCIDGLDKICWSEEIGNAIVERVPVGTVAAITPWNAPLHQITAKVVGALAAGCSVVLKPSEVAPGVAVCFMEAVREAGLPPGVVNLIWGDAELSSALVNHAGIDLISFTGSTEVGRTIMSSAAKRLAKVSLELGGKSAAIVLEDADLSLALPAVLRMSMANSGQVCVSQSRLLVPRSLLAETNDRLSSLVCEWRVGDPSDRGSRIGPVSTARQFDRIQLIIDRAIKSGATVLCGGLGRPEGIETGYYVRPTIFTNVAPTAEVAQVEVFGPVLSVTAFDDIEQAVMIANSTIYGLSGAVWAKDRETAAAVARKIESGQVIINGAAQNLATPFGGWRQSGIGRENGRFGIEEFLQYRSLQGLK